jgi:hypothetical protein
VKLLESLEDVLGVNNMVNMGDDICVASQEQQLIDGNSGYGDELVSCERVTLRVEFLVEQIEGFSSGAFGLRSNSGFSLYHLAPFLFSDSGDGTG